MTSNAIASALREGLEQWRPVVGWEGLYEVSNQGRVRSPSRPDGLSLQKHSGYCAAHLFSGARHRRVRVHRLVIEAFVGPQPTSRHEVNHKNGVKDDNRVENLEWVTRSENDRHAFALGLRRTRRNPGEKNGHAKLIEADVTTIRARHAAAGEYYRDIAAAYGVSADAIEKICRRKTWRHLP